MTEYPAASDAENLAAHAELFRLVNSNWKTQAVSVAAELGLADLLADGVNKADKLAKATGCHTQSLHRLLRALASLNICEEREDGSFALTTLGSLLRSDAPASLRDLAIWGGKYQWPMWGHLLHSVKTGNSARTLVEGTASVDHPEHDPEATDIFHRAMFQATRAVARAVVSAYDFSCFRRIVDVGGGYGEMLAAVLRAFPLARGVLFDLPTTLEGARRHLKNEGVLDRCESIGGSFFDAVPGGGDGYILKSVIHDWNNKDSIAILRRCREAMQRSAKLLLVEPVMPERVEHSLHHQDVARRDLNVLVMLGSQERTKREYSALLDSTGFSMRSIVPAALNFSVIEAACV